MNDAAPPDVPETDALDPLKASPRDLMMALIPEARTLYIKAWELLADASTPLERRRVARKRAATIAEDHAILAAVLRQRESSLKGDDLLNVQHLASELERHVEALKKIAEMSAIGLVGSDALRPEALGCGKRYRDPARTNAQSGSASRGTSGKPASKPHNSRDRERSNSRPFSDRGPKVARDALGTSKHDVTLADDMDDNTRAKLEALRRELEGSE